MANYTFVPFLNGCENFNLSLSCLPCKNKEEAISMAIKIKESSNFDFVTIYKRITQV